MVCGGRAANVLADAVPEALPRTGSKSCRPGAGAPSMNARRPWGEL